MEKITIQEWAQINNIDIDKAFELFNEGKIPNAYIDHYCYVHIYMQDTTISEHINDVIKTEQICTAANILGWLVDSCTSHNDIITRLLDAMDLEEATITK